MGGSHPLDYPVWSALSGRQARFGVVDGGARRYQPAVGVFAAVGARDADSLAALGRLVRAHGDVAILEAEEPPTVPGAMVVSAEQKVTQWLTNGKTVSLGHGECRVEDAIKRIECQLRLA